MAVLSVHEGIYRAARRIGRGRRKRRGEFISLDSFPIPTAVPVTSVDPANSPGFAELRVSEERDASGAVSLRMCGTLDLATVLPFRDAVFTAIGRRPSALLLDLGNLEAVDIAGISSLVTVGRVARLLSVPFYLTPSPSLRTTLESTGLSRMVATTARDAVQ